ncbi:hypothetical protein AnigIFM60653_000433 [Aspergillus niger]|nr:hypothetical protein AnigIFM50267_005794 [Aspergillus niger]GKZ77250.1 hypothetical protein AnigIFM56816_010052 [Aspergillus niger]GLA01499.1 hypothetical protein AnigIFM60653_000433 [Aspergillus niger]
MDMEALLQPPEFSSVKWREGMSEDNSAPKYLMPTQRRRGQLSKAQFSTLEVRIGDLGGDLLSRHGQYQLNMSNTVTKNQ